MKALVYDYKIVLTNGSLDDYIPYIKTMEQIYGDYANYLFVQGNLTIYPNISGKDARILDIILKLIKDGVPMEAGN